jgi:hypothetical protein
LTVQRTTATLFICLTQQNGLEVRVRRSDGYVIGRDYTHIIPITKQIKQEIADSDLLVWATKIFGDINRKRVPLPVIRAMRQAYSKAMTEQKQVGSEA